MELNNNGFYIIKDEYFKLIKDNNFKFNYSGNRPYYYCFKDDQNSNIFWMIPMSHQIDKYRRIINNRLKLSKSCDILHIAKLDNGRESVFLIQDILPITIQYIKREYTIGKNQLVLTSEKEQKIVHKKARKILKLIKNNVRFMPTQINIDAIIEQL